MNALYILSIVNIALLALVIEAHFTYKESKKRLEELEIIIARSRNCCQREG